MQMHDLQKEFSKNDFKQQWFWQEKVTIQQFEVLY